jgi:hypothetical protein
MKWAGQMGLGLYRQRGFWLRCFLGSAWRIALLGAGLSGILHAQPDVVTPIHLTHVDGYVVNSLGKPVVGAETTLVRDGSVAYRTRTDNAGAFHFDHLLGKYVFKVGRTEYAPAAREVNVGSEIVTYLERRKLYVIVGPGACMEECSAVFTSKHEFDRAIKNKNRH